MCVIIFFFGLARPAAFLRMETTSVLFHVESSPKTRIHTWFFLEPSEFQVDYVTGSLPAVGWFGYSRGCSLGHVQ